MAYNAKFNIPDSKLGNADVVFTIYTGQQKLGELHISKGRLAWKPLSGKESYKMAWTKFGTIMQKYGRKLAGT